MKTIKKSAAKVGEALAALVQQLIAAEPYEFEGYVWAPRPRSYYCEMLG